MVYDQTMHTHGLGSAQEFLGDHLHSRQTQKHPTGELPVSESSALCVARSHVGMQTVMASLISST